MHLSGVVERAQSLSPDSFMGRISPYSLLLLCLLCVPSAFGQLQDDVQITPRSTSQQSPRQLEGLPSAKRLRVNVDMVLVPVSVTDTKNHPVIDLAKQNFRLFEGEREEPIQYFTTEDTPLSVGILVDLSSSMGNKIDAVRLAADEFFKNANPEDDYFVITFADKPKVIANTTRSAEDIHAALAAATPKGNTALADAIYMG